jgi:hypothetical protein
MLKGVFIILVVLVLLSGLSIAYATTAEVSTLTTTRLPLQHTTVSLEQEGLTQINQTGTHSTSKWSGITGFLGGKILLGNSVSNVLKNWAVSNTTGSIIFASNESISNWDYNFIERANATHMPYYLQTKSLDNYTNTFNQTELFTTPNKNFLETPFTELYLNDTSKKTKTYSLRMINQQALLWATRSNQSIINYAGDEVDFQLIVPAKEQQTYHIYVELL